jgi:hypothetical protein
LHRAFPLKSPPPKQTKLTWINARLPARSYQCAVRKEEAAMGFSMPKYTDANDIVDRALNAGAKDIPVSLGNLMPAFRWKLAELGICEQMLAERVRKRAAELDVALID